MPEQLHLQKVCFYIGLGMHKEEEKLQNALTDLWDIMESAESVLMNKHNDDIDSGETPDFSAVIQSILRDSAGLENIEIDSVPDPETGHTTFNDLPDYAASCRNLADITWKVNECTLCGLYKTRTHAVPGNGVMNPKVMIIGEAPGAQEDKTGEPFVGPAGKYLDAWMGAIKLFRGRDLFIGNIIKCRPPGNRDPFPDEKEACLPYLKRQIQIIKPKTILCVGRIAAQILTENSVGIGQLRTSQYTFEGIPMIVTYHPSAVLRYPEDYRKPVWEDLQKLLKLIR